MIFAFIITAMLIGSCGLLLRLSCWLYNRWFIDLPVSAQTAVNDVKFETEQQANPFAPPRQAVQPASMNEAVQSRVVVPSLGISIVLGFLLLGLQVAVSGAAMVILQPIVAAY